MICSKCNIEKDLDSYYFDSYRGKHRSYCKECAKSNSKRYYELNKDERLAKNRDYNKTKKGKLSYKVRQKKWKDNNPEYYKKYRKEYYSLPINKFKDGVRCCIKSSMRKRGYTKNSRTFDILGCDYETFVAHISKQFKKGMTLDNHGEWHLDHIIPISTAQTEEEVIKLNHYTNFQPLWAKENLQKSNKIIEHQLNLGI